MGAGGGGGGGGSSTVVFIRLTALSAYLIDQFRYIKILTWLRDQKQKKSQ